MRARDLRLSSKRLAIVRALMLIGFVALAARAAHLTVVSNRGAEQGSAQIFTALKISPERGLILDRTGAELAISVDAPSLYAIVTEVEDIPTTARRLAKVLGTPHTNLEKRLRSHSGFAFLKRWITPEQAAKIKALELPGIGLVPEPRRVYPYRELAAQIVGFANIDGQGVRGIEALEDAWLQGSPRSVPVERDARGRLLALPGVDPRLASGGDVMLTLHAAMQADAEAALETALKKTGAKSGIVVSMDPHTGDILAVAERPIFDPNHFRKTSFSKTRSRAFLDAFEPGSTMKAFLVAGALQENAIQPDELFDCENGSYRVPGKTIRDHSPHGLLNARSILQVSSNIGSIKIADQLGPKAYYQTLLSFGFGKSTGSGFPHESSGLIRSWRKWRPLDQANISFGQGLNVTPIQLASAAATLANDGIRMKPRLVAATRRSGEDWDVRPPQREKKAVSSETARAVVSMLEEVVTSEGTARKAALRNVRVAGKTGTAQIFDTETRTYSKDRYTAWFVGIAPADDPKLVVVVQLEEPQGQQHTGGDVAAPLFAEIATAHLAQFNILTQPEPKKKIWHPVAEVELKQAVVAPPSPKPEPLPLAAVSAPSKDAAPPPAHAPKTSRALLPDFKGLTVAEVKTLTSQDQLNVTFLGSGRAISQTPEPGSVIAPQDDPVFVYFSNAGEEG